MQRRKRELFKGYLGTNIISQKKKTTSIWFLKMLKIQPLFFKDFNVKLCVFIASIVCVHTHGYMLSSLGLPQKCGGIS